MATATLGFEVQTGNLDQALAKLKDLVPAAATAEAAVKKLETTVNSIGQKSAAGKIIDTAKLQQQATEVENFSKRIERALNFPSFTSGNRVGTPFENALGRAADIQAYGNSLDQLRGKFNPIFAAGQQYKNMLGEIRQAYAVGAISANEMTAAIERQKVVTQQAVAAAQAAGMGGGGRGGTPRSAISGQQAMLQSNLMFQMQDIAVTTAMGMNPMMIALQQGTQIGAALTAAGGARAGIQGLTAALRGLLSVSNLLPIALIAVGAAAIQYFTNAGKGAKTLEEALKTQEKAIQNLAKAYGMATDAADKYYKRTTFAAASEAITATQDLQKQLDQANKEFQNSTLRFITPTRSAAGYFGPTRSEFKPFDDALQSFRTSAKDLGAYDKLQKDLAATVALNPELAGTAAKIWDLAKAGAEAAAAISKTNEMLKTMPSFEQTERARSFRQQERGTAGTVRTFEQQRAEQEARDQRIFDAEMQRMRARTDAERVAAAEEAARAEIRIEGREKELAVEKAIARERAAIEKEHSDAIRERDISRAKSVDDARHELDMIGKTASEQAYLNAIYQQTQALKEEAIRTGQSYTEMLAKEGDQIRQNAEDLAKLAQASTQKRLRTDLQFELEQLGRSPGEQSIAERLRGTGLGMDSAEADTLRYIDQVKRIQDTWQGVFDTVNDGVDTMVDALFDGTDDWGETLKKIGRDFARQMFDLALTNPLKNFLTGANLNTVADLVAPGTPGFSSGRGSGFGGFLGKIFGIGGGAPGGMSLKGTIADPVAVTVVGGLGSLLPGGGGGTGGAGDVAQNYIQSRIDSAFGTKPASSAIGTGQNYIQSRIDQAFGTTGGGGGLTGELGKAAAAIRSIESGSYAGNYSALGPVVTSGMYKGQRAIGAYQMMPGNIPEWSKQTFGSAMTPEQVFGNKEAQDAIFAKIFGKDMARYGPEGAARKWFTGSPTGGGRDVLGTTGAGYQSKFSRAFANAPATDEITSSVKKAVEPLADVATKAADSLREVGLSGFEAVKGLTDASGGLTKFGSLLSSFMGPGGGAGSGWFQGLVKIAGSAASAITGMQAISPAATQAIIAGGALGPAGLYHEGGIAGSPASMRYASPMVFMNAPRYHNGGLAGDEVPAILKRGEMIFRSAAHARAVMNTNDNSAGAASIVAALRSMKLSVKNINVQDPDVVGDYLRTSKGEKAHVNVMRRTNTRGQVF